MLQVRGIYENGHIRLLTPIHKKKARVIVTVLEEEEATSPSLQTASLFKRIPGLNKGTYFMADDFDEPLPDSFWTGKVFHYHKGTENTKKDRKESFVTFVSLW